MEAGVWDMEYPYEHAPPTTHHRTGPAWRPTSTVTFHRVTFDPLGVVRTDFSMCQWWHAVRTPYAAHKRRISALRRT